MGTRIDVRVIAKGGKYLGDDIGGALVTVHDVRTGELLARGTTWDVPPNSSGQPQIYGITVTAFQPLTGNTGVDRATLIIPVPPSTQGSRLLSR